jgi:hypothetical protein
VSDDSETIMSPADPRLRSRFDVRYVIAVFDGGGYVGGTECQRYTAADSTGLGVDVVQTVIA